MNRARQPVDSIEESTPMYFVSKRSLHRIAALLDSQVANMKLTTRPTFGIKYGSCIRGATYGHVRALQFHG